MVVQPGHRAEKENIMHTQIDYRAHRARIQREQRRVTQRNVPNNKIQKSEDNQSTRLTMGTIMTLLMVMVTTLLGQ
jgi:hypothetical protein